MAATLTEVRGAVGEIHDRTGRWPTPAAISAHLGYHVSEVQEPLRDLRRMGVLVCRKRGSGRNQRREWMPRGER